MDDTVLSDACAFVFKQFYVTKMAWKFYWQLQKQFVREAKNVYKQF